MCAPATCGQWLPYWECRYRAFPSSWKVVSYNAGIQKTEWRETPASTDQVWTCQALVFPSLIPVLYRRSDSKSWSSSKTWLYGEETESWLKTKKQIYRNILTWDKKRKAAAQLSLEKFLTLEASLGRTIYDVFSPIKLNLNRIKPVALTSI